MRQSPIRPLRLLDPLRVAAALGLALVASACGSTARTNGTSDDGGVVECTNKETRCQDGKWQTCASQTWKDVETCAAWCDKALGCTKCPPNGTFCEGQNVISCDAQGNPGKLRATCADMCVGGTCTDACGRAAAELSYLGCVYYPTVTSNQLLTESSHFAVAVANPNTDSVDLEITRGDFKLDNIHIAPGDLQTIQLPWVKELLQPGGLQNAGKYYSSLVKGGAYKLNASQPVNVYQFNPLEFEVKKGCNPNDLTCFTFTNDASILLPTSTLTGHYIVLSRETWMRKATAQYMGMDPWPVQKLDSASPGFFVVVGAEDVEQEVTIKFRAPTLASLGGTVNAFRSGESGKFMLKEGDVLQIMSAAPPDCAVKPGDTSEFVDDNNYWWVYGYCDLGEGWDLTGTEISSDHKLAVFGGHDCSYVPYNKAACDHLEEGMIPLEGWGKQYIGSHSQRSPATIPDIWRVVSGSDGNTITFDPPSVHDPVMLDRGKWIEFATKSDFVANGMGTFAVAQYMVGQNYANNSAGPGDPAMSIAVPTEQYRKDYTFLTPASYTYNYVNVTAPANQETGDLLADITLDGKVMDSSTFKPIGNGFYKVARVRLETDGTHKISSAQAFGIAVYGLASYTSYMYPGGLDVKQINLQ